MNFNLVTSKSVVFLFCLILAVMVAPAWALVFEWDGDTDVDFGTVANWTGVGQPSVGANAGNSLLFDDTGIGNSAITGVGAAYTGLGGISFTGATGGYSFAGAGSFGLNTGTVITGDGQTHTFNITLDAAGAGFSFEGSSNYIIGDVTSGTAINFNTIGTVTLNANNGHANSVLTQGTLILGHDNALGTGGFTLAGSGAIQASAARSITNTIDLGANTLTVSGTENIDFGAAISGTGALTVNVTDTTDEVTLSVANSYGGNTTLTKGTLVLGHDDALGTTGSLVLDGVDGEGSVQASADGRNIGNDISLGADLTVSGGFNLILDGDITGASGLTVNMDTAADTLTLSGTNGYTGGVTLTQGTAILGDDTALGTGTLGVGAAATIQSNDDARSITNLINLGANNLAITGGSNLELGGVISGTGTIGVTLGGAANTLTLSGTNTYSGNTTLTTGTLILGNNNAFGDGTGSLVLAGAGTIQADGTRTIANGITLGAALTVSGTSNMTLSGKLTGASTLTKAGTGTLTLSDATNDYTGLTLLNAGSLILTGTIGGDLTVAGGTFSGTGNVVGAGGGTTLAMNGGIIAPGNSIGILTIAGGNYTQAAGATYNVEINKTSGGTLTSDLINVTAGTATLANGTTINVLDISPTNVLITTGDQFTIIQTTGGVTDLGASFTDNSAVLSFTGGVSGTNYLLTATRQAFSTAVTGGNRSAVMTAIDGDLASATGDYITVINELTALDSTHLNKASEQLDSMPHAAASTVSTITSQRMAGNMSNYLGARRSGLASLTSFSSQQSANRLLIADSSANPKILGHVIEETERLAQDSDQQSSERIVNGFIKPFGVMYDQDSTTNMVGFKAKAIGAQIGIDKHVTDEWILGIGGGYSRSFIDFEDSRGDGEVDSYRLGPYATYYTDKYYVDLSISMGYHDNSMERNIRFGNINRIAKSDYSSYEFSTYIGGGYHIDRGNWRITPSASLQHIYLRSESFSETGAGAAGLKVSSQTSNSLASRLGVTVSTQTTLFDKKIVPEISVGWAHEFIDEEDVESRFVNGTTNFTTEVDSDRDDSIYFGAGLTMLLNKNISAHVKYSGEHYSGGKINALNVGFTLLF